MIFTIKSKLFIYYIIWNELWLFIVEEAYYIPLSSIILSYETILITFSFFVNILYINDFIINLYVINS